MTGRQSSAVASAVKMVQKGHKTSDAADRYKVAPSSIRRALKAAGAPDRRFGKKTDVLDLLR